MEEETVICSLCSAASHLRFNIKGYIQHIRLFHAHQVDFKITCGIGGCQRSFTNCGTFINHVYGVHGENHRAACEVVQANGRSLDYVDGDDDDNDSDDDEDNYSGHTIGQDYEIVLQKQEVMISMLFQGNVAKIFCYIFTWFEGEI